MMRRFFRSIRMLAVAVAILSATESCADVDMTGDWNFECDASEYFGYELRFSSSVSIVQTGAALQWGLGGSGTIDPSTGSFIAEGPPVGIFALRDSWDGTVSADSNRMEGTCHGYRFAQATPVPVSYPMRGIRDGIAVCGDIQRDPGEGCDHGTSNGSDGCCSADCSLVDPDDDGICTDIDVCPDQYDVGQVNRCGGIPPFEVTKLTIGTATRLPARDNSRVRITGLLRGIGAARLTSLEEFRVGPGVLVTGLVCSRVKPRRLDCATIDGSKKLKIRTNAESLRIRATFSGVGLESAPETPVEVSFRDQFGQLRVAEVYSCRGCALP